MSAQDYLEGMSSAVERDPLDFNKTPAWVVKLLIPHLGQPRTVLDVGCGDGAIGKVLRQAWPTHLDMHLVGIEIDDWRQSCAHHTGAYNAMYHQSWLDDGPAWQWWQAAPPWYEHREGPALIISNPPFGLPARRFLELALERVAPGGTVAFLLPTHWDHDPDVREGYARQRFLDALRTPDGREGYGKLAVVGGGPYPARPSFKKGGTASDRYAWLMFGPGWAGVHRRLHAIPPAADNGQMVIGGT